MNKLKIIFLYVCTICVFSTLCFASLAPDEQVRTTYEKVKQAVQGKQGETVIDQNIRNILQPMFNWKEMARSSLGANWQKATADEQQQYVDLFTDLLARTYLKRIKSNVLSSTLEIRETKIDGDKALVRTYVKAEGENAAIDYRLKNEGSKWQAYDVLIENVGLISNYRTEFAGIVRKDGMKGLIEQLKKKQVKGNAK